MNEQVIQFGKDNSLMGILTTPDEQTAIADAPVALILNAGIVHRVGPFRLHVDLARLMAENGFSTFRIDLSGLGDSLPGNDVAGDGNSGSEFRAINDARLALDKIEKELGVRRFVVIGLCSGAFNSHYIALNEKRIVGSVMIDGIVFPTTGYFWRHTVGRLFKFRVWRNAFANRIRKRQMPVRPGSGFDESEFFFSDQLDRQVISSEIRSFHDRGLKMLFVYTGGYDDVCGRQQFHEMFGIQPDDDQLQVDYYPDAEHTFRLTENRERLCQRISNWYREQFSQ